LLGFGEYDDYGHDYYGDATSTSTTTTASATPTGRVLLSGVRSVILWQFPVSLEVLDYASVLLATNLSMLADMLQCGGEGYTGSTVCESPYTCVEPLFGGRSANKETLTFFLTFVDDILDISSGVFNNCIYLRV